MFREYKITGVKLEYRPYFFSAGTDNLFMKAITCGTKMAINGIQAVPVPLFDFRASLDAKTYDPQRPFKRYYHVSKWGSQHEINWRNSADALLNVYGNASPDCMTCMELDCGGYADGALIGSVMVTYFVKFRSR